MTRAFARRNKFLYSIRKGDKTHPIVITDCREGQNRTKLRGQLPLKLFCRTKKTRCRHIQNQHHRQFPLFNEFLDVGMTRPGGNISVYKTEFVSRLIFPDLLKLHTPALEYALVLSGKNIINHPGGSYLDTPDIF